MYARLYRAAADMAGPLGHFSNFKKMLYTCISFSCSKQSCRCFFIFITWNWTCELDLNSLKQNSVKNAILECTTLVKAEVGYKPAIPIGKPKSHPNLHAVSHACFSLDYVKCSKALGW